MNSTDLLVVGELNADLILRGGDVVPSFGQAEQVVSAADLVLGASGAITACSAARLGASVAYTGVIGDDLIGRFVLGELETRGVDVALVLRRSGERTGLSVVLAREHGDRATLTYPGLIAALRAEDVPAEALRCAGHVHVASPFLQTALRTDLADLLRAAKVAGATTSLDPNWDPSGRWNLDEVLPHLDLFLPNAGELHHLTGEADVERAAARIAAAGPTVVVKRGVEGAMLHDGKRTFWARAPIVDEVVDTTGAGDNFDAGYLIAWLDGCRTAGALRLGCAVAGLSLRAAGGTGGQPDREEAERLAATLEFSGPVRSEHVLAESEPAYADATSEEIVSQPDVWRRALALPEAEYAKLPTSGSKVLALGCGTSYHVLDAYAHRRQELDGGITRAVIGSELDEREDYDAVLFLSRSGTTSALLRANERFAGRVPTIALVGDPDSPLPREVDATILLPFADERSVVQTRFATTALAVLRRSLGEQLDGVVRDAGEALANDVPFAALAFEHLVFLGSGWTLGVAHEAALKCREAAQLFTEAYATGEYQHGPIALADERTLVWSLSPLPDDLRQPLKQTGATVREAVWDPLAELVAVHRLAVATAHAKGLDPDRPRALKRSVVLEG